MKCWDWGYKLRRHENIKVTGNWRPPFCEKVDRDLNKQTNKNQEIIPGAHHQEEGGERRKKTIKEIRTSGQRGHLIAHEEREESSS